MPESSRRIHDYIPPRAPSSDVAKNPSLQELRRKLPLIVTGNFGLTDLETENARLRKAISDLTLDNVIMQEAAKNF